MRIGVLTGGGDVPGLNACIKAVVNRVADEGHQVVGIRRGWGGLVAVNPADDSTVAGNLLPLDPNTVRTVDRTGGTQCPRMTGGHRRGETGSPVHASHPVRVTISPPGPITLDSRHHSG